jgi:hypothetical protein
MSDGTFYEVRRGPYEFDAIPDPHVWNTVSDWKSQCGYLWTPVVNAMWHPDAARMSMWFYESNLTRVPIPQDEIDELSGFVQYIHAIVSAKIASGAAFPEIQMDMIIMGQNTTKLLHMQAEQEQGGRWTGESSDVFVFDTVSGTMVPIYMNLETGTMGTLGGSTGFCFADLNIVPYSVMKYAMGSYYRV